MKVAGGLAVQIQNEKLGSINDDGFGKLDDTESDAYSIECLRSYWMSLGMTDDQVKDSDTKIRTFVRGALSHYWLLVEAVAVEIAALKPSGPPLPAARIGAIINALEPTFYDRVKAHLLSD